MSALRAIPPTAAHASPAELRASGLAFAAPVIPTTAMIRGRHDADSNDASPENERLGRCRGKSHVHHVGDHANDGNGNRHQRSDRAPAAKLRTVAFDGAQDAEQERAARKGRAEVSERQSLGTPRRLRLDDVTVPAEEAQHKAEHDARYREGLRGHIRTRALADRHGTRPSR